MTSSIINFIVEKYLSNIVEINPEKTKSSLWSGTVEMSNLKIKREIFETIDLPYCELVNGYIGKLTIQLQLPRFYLYPIKVNIDKVFFHARQKKLDKLNKEEEIKGIENYKNSKLQSVEEFKSEINQFQNEAPGMTTQIINNLQITINDIVVRFDDEISYEKMPFTFGILMKSLKICTTNDKYEFKEGENIPYGEINYKIIQLNNLSVYLDTFQKGEKLDFKKQIVDNENTVIENERDSFLGEAKDYYKYCLSEVNVHINEEKAHEYLLYNMGLDLKTAMNDLYSKNNKPKIFATCELKDVITNVSIQQIFVLFKLLAYINLNQLYRNGISKDYYVKKLTNEEKVDYIDNYYSYHNFKYGEKKNVTEADNLRKKVLLPVEEGLTYEQIQSLRDIAQMKIEHQKKMRIIESEISKAKSQSSGSMFNVFSYFGSSEPTKEQKELMESLEQKKAKLENEEEEIDKEMQKKMSQEEQTAEIDFYRDIPDAFPLYHVEFIMPKCHMNILENKGLSMVDIVYENFKIQGELRKKGQLFSLFIDDIKVLQRRQAESPYKSIMETIIDENDKENNGAINMEFENNPALPKSNYRFKFRHSKLLVITLNLYAIQYISNRVLTALSSTINKEDVTNYAVGEVSKYIQAGYVEKMLAGDYQHFNIDLDIVIKSPILLLPQNVCDYENKNCMMVKFGDLEMKSNLPPRQTFDKKETTEEQEKESQKYIYCTDINVMYDEYTFTGKKFSLITLTDFSGDINKLSEAKQLKLIEDVALDFSMKNSIESRNQNFENLVMTMTIHEITMNLRDSQLVFLIKFLDGFSRVGAQLAEDLKESELPVEEKPKTAEEKKKIKEEKDEKKKQMKKTAAELKTAVKQEEKKILVEKPKDKVVLHFNFEHTSVNLNILKTISFTEREILLSSSSVELHNKEYKEYVSFSMNYFGFDFKMTENANMNLLMKIESISMSDDEIIYTAEKVNGVRKINSAFQYIISSRDNKPRLSQHAFFNPSNDGLVMSIIQDDQQQSVEPFINIEYNYLSAKKLTEMKLSMQKLKIFFNYTTLSNVYQFYNYYIGLLFKIQNDFQKEQKLKKLSLKESLSKSTLSSSRMDDSTTHEFFDEYQLLNDPNSIVESDEKSKMTIDFTMKDIEMFMPLEDTKEATDLMRFNFNLVTKISMKNEYHTVHTKELYTLIKNDYSVKDMKLSTMVYNIDFDVIKFKGGDFRGNRIGNKILSNFRINTNIDSFLIVEESKNVMAIDVKLEPMSMVVGFREIKSIQKFINSMLQFLTDMNKPYDDPRKTIDKAMLEIEEEKKEEEEEEKEKEENFNDEIMEDEENNNDDEGVVVVGDEMVIDTSKKDKKPKKKLTFKERQQKLKIKMEKKIYNISNFNFQMDILFQMDKISMKFLDNTTMYNTPLLNIESNKISFKYISNSTPRDQDNMANAIVESITHNKISLDEYNVLNLYQYIDMSFNVEINFFNDKVNDWEPIMEPWMGNMKLSQVDRYTKMRIEFNSDELLNYNLSVYSVKVFNSVMKKLYQNEEEWDQESRKQSRVSDRSISGGDLSVEFINCTGVDVMYKFDADSEERKEYLLEDIHKIIQRRKEDNNLINTNIISSNNEIGEFGNSKKRKFTRNELEKINRQLTDETSLLLLKDKISFKIGNYHTVNNHDFSYSHISSYLIMEKMMDSQAPSRSESIRGRVQFNVTQEKKAKTERLLLNESVPTSSNLESEIGNAHNFDIIRDGEPKHIEVTVKTILSGLTRKIIFESNVTFFNNLEHPINLYFISQNDFISKFNSIDGQVVPPINDVSGGDIPKCTYIIKPQSHFVVPLFFIMNDYRVYSSIGNSNQYSLVHENFGFIHKQLKTVMRYDKALGSTDEKDAVDLPLEGSKMLDMSLNEKEYYVSLDMMIHRGLNDVVKSQRQIKDEESLKTKERLTAQKKEETIDTAIEAPQKDRKFKETAKTYSYYFVFNQSVIIENQIPYNVKIDLVGNDQNGETETLSVSPLELVPFYKINPVNDVTKKQMVVKLQYGKKTFSSTPMSIQAIFGQMLKVIPVQLTNTENPKDIMTFKLKVEDKDVLHNIYPNTFLKLIKNITQRKHLVFFFDYIVVNKSPIDLYAKEAKSSQNDIDIEKTNGAFPGKSLSLFCSSKESIQIRNVPSLWSKPFSINTFGMSGVCSLEREVGTNIIDKKHNDILIEDLAAKISSSSYFKNSTIVTFEERFLLFNKLGLEVHYQQKDPQNFEYAFDTVTLENDETKMLSFIKTSKKMKKMIRLSIDNKYFSSVFKVDEIADFNVKIPIEDQEMIDKITNLNQEIDQENAKIKEENKKLDKKEQKKLKDKYTLYSTNEIKCLVVNVSIYSYDNGLIYIVIHNPSFIDYKIKNKLEEKVIIEQKKIVSDTNRIDIEGGKSTPYVWEDLIQEEKLLLCTINEVTTEIEFSKIEKTETEIKGNKYFFQIILEDKNRTRTLVISRSNEGIKQKRNNILSVLTGVRRTTNMEFNMKMKGVGLSIIDQEPKEVFYISFYQIDLSFTSLTYNRNKVIDTTNNILLYLKNFQIDYCLEDSFKTVIKPRQQIVPSNEEQVMEKEKEVLPFIHLFFSNHTLYNPKNNSYTTNFPQVDFIMQELDVFVDQFSALTLLKLQGEILAELDFFNAPQPGKEEKVKKEKEEEDNVDKSKYDPSFSLDIKPPEQIIENSNNPSMIFVNYLLLSAMKINLTLRIDLSAFDISLLPGIMIKILASLGNSLARISNSPLRFSEMMYENVFTDAYQMVWLIIQHYKRQGLIEAYKLFGSSDLLGNPIGFVDKIGTGFIEFFNEPRKGFLKGPTQFGEGLKKGFGSLISNIVGGSFDVVGKITGTLLTATKTIQGEKINLREDDEPENIIFGIYDGLKGGVIELGKGITGIFTNPYKRAKKQGVKGFFKGIGAGLIGAIVSPFSAALRIGNSVFVGMKNTANLFSKGKVKTLRFRHPRTIEKVIALKPYDEDMAEVQAILRGLKIEDAKILYFRDFRYYETGYDDQDSTLILTDVKLYVIYNVNEIAFNLKLMKIKEVEVHFEKDEYIILFTLFTGSKKYITTKDLTMCCVLYSILEKYCQSNR